MRLIFILLLLTSFELYAKVTASVDQNKIRYGHSLQLNVSSDNAAGLSPNLAKLKRNFKIIGSSKVSRPHIKNGQRQIKTLWFYVLQPKLSGNLTIPVIKINGEKTKPIPINVQAIKKSKQQKVAKIAQNKKLDTHNIIVKATLNNNRIYPNEMLKYHLSINTPKENNGDFKVNAPFIAGAIVLPLTQMSVKQTTLRGKLRNVYSQSFAIFAEQVAIYQIEPASIVYSETVQPGTAKELHLKANNLHFEVTPKANQSSLGYWLPSESISLTEAINIPKILNKGDQISRTITLNGQGLDSDSLPLMSTLTHENIRISLEDVTLSSEMIAGELIATRSETVSMTFTSSGTISVEPIDIHWWNTTVDQARVATLPAYTFKVTDLIKPLAHPNTSSEKTVSITTTDSQNQITAETLPPLQTPEKLFSDSQLNALIGILFTLLVMTTAGWLVSLRSKKS